MSVDSVGKARIVDWMVGPIVPQASPAWMSANEMYIVGLVNTVPNVLAVTAPVAGCDNPGGKYRSWTTPP
jgi:hypothetical protein